MAIMSIDPAVWRAASPTKVKIPAVGSRVYYFPQGHSEQASSAPDFSGMNLTKPFFLCVVSKNHYLADPDTDEVFLRISLLPIPLPPAPTPEPPAEDPFAAVSSFSKVLTPSDANNGGGFSVPRFCAESVFPPLDFANSETPVQTITLKDLVGLTWQFRHIYRGTPRRHLLTTGWSKFVNAKKLVAGDTIVFVKDDADEIFVGIRRRPCRAMPFAGVAADSNAGGFVRDGRGRVKPAAIAAAVGAAEAGIGFDVDFYPGPGRAEFVVAEGVVEAAMSVGPARWVGGARVRMPTETEEPSRVAWYLGYVSSAAAQYKGAWAQSPWRMLQVIWDEREDQPVTSLSPWQVELIAPPPSTSTFHNIDMIPSSSSSSSYPPPVAKRPRIFPTNSQLGGDDDHNPNSTDLMMTSLFSNMMSMQGARQGGGPPLTMSAFTPYIPTNLISNGGGGHDLNINNVVVEGSSRQNYNLTTEHDHFVVNPMNAESPSSPSPSSRDSILCSNESNNNNTVVAEEEEDGIGAPSPGVMLFGQNIHTHAPEMDREVTRAQSDDSSSSAGDHMS